MSWFNKRKNKPAPLCDHVPAPIVLNGVEFFWHKDAEERLLRQGVVIKVIFVEFGEEFSTSVGIEGEGNDANH